MFTNINWKIIAKITVGLPRTPLLNSGQALLVLAMTVITYLSLTPVLAYGLTQDESIDLAMGVLEGPVYRRILIPPGTQEGAPLFPTYKQEPPATQEDFRPIPEPIVTPLPEPKPKEPEPPPIPEPKPKKPEPPPIHVFHSP